MKLRTAILGALAAGSLSMSGAILAQSAPTTAAPMQQGGQQQSGERQVEGDDKDFLENAAQSSHTEIEGSKLAQQKATNPDVKAFAEQMITDHSKVDQELVALAKSKGYTPPTEPSIIQRTKLKAMSVMDGDNFDKTYVNQVGVAAHEDAVKLFQKASEEAEDPEIKAFAAKTLPALQKHLEMAKALKQKVDP